MDTIQNYGISNCKNINKNSNVSFTAGTISPELVTQIGQFSVKFAKGNLRNANEYNNFIIGILNKALEKFSPDMVLSSKPCYHNGIKRNALQ